MSLKYRLEQGFDRKPTGRVIINMENSIKAIAGMLLLRRNMLEKDVTSKWGKESWEAMSAEQKDFWTYVYFNRGHAYSTNGELAGKGLLYEKGIDWMYSTPESYKKVHSNAARTVGGAQLAEETGALER